MILPIYAYGNSVLKTKTKDINTDYSNLSELIDNMWETMYNAHGIGLAAPQVGLSLRLFLVDTTQGESEEDDFVGIKQVFINAQILDEFGEYQDFEEGCLSIPQIRGDVERLDTIEIRYWDENFVEHTQEFDGLNARVIQHEYDHIEGLLFTEKLKPLKRKMIQRKLEKIRKGKITSDYRMVFARH